MDQKILIVDDDPELRELLMTVIADEGFAVESAEDGQDALRVLSKNMDIAVVISDLIMPNMDGRELLKSINLNFPSIPVVILSGGMTQAEADKKLTEAFRFIAKPADMREIIRALLDAATNSTPKA